MTTYRFDQIAELITVRVAPGETALDRYVGLEHLDSETLKISRWGSPKDVIGQKHSFWPGDIIFGKRRAYQRKLAVANFEGICSAHAMVLRAKPEVVLPEFLPFFMQSDLFMNRALDISVGSLSPTINWRTLAEQDFPLPPLDEQRRIANLLWKIEDVIDGTMKVISSLKRLKNSFRREKFSNIDSKVLLKDLCEPKGIQIGPFGSQLHASDYVSDGIPVIMPANMTEDLIDQNNISKISKDMADSLSHHKVLSGDILLPRRGDLDRRAFIRPEQEGWLCGTGSVRIRVKKEISPRAVFQAIASPATVKWLNNHAIGTTMPNINSTIVSNIPISLPPLNEIERDVKTLEYIDISLQVAYEKLAKGIKLKKKYLRLMGE